MSLDPTPVVLLHGVRVSSTMWGPLAAALGRHREVATPDLPGHGIRKDEPFTTDAAVAVVRETIAALGGRAVVAGHSLGGFIAITAAGRHPGSVAGLVAMGCTARPRGPGLRAYRALGSYLSRDIARGDRATDRGLRAQLPPEKYAAAAAGGYTCAVAATAIDAIAGLDPLADLAAYPGPVWLLNGSLDQMRIDERRFFAACQDGRLTVWPRLTHISIAGQTARLTRFIEDACAVVDLARLR